MDTLSLAKFVVGALFLPIAFAAVGFFLLTLASPTAPVAITFFALLAVSICLAVLFHFIDRQQSDRQQPEQPATTAES